MKISLLKKLISRKVTKIFYTNFFTSIVIMYIEYMVCIDVNENIVMYTKISSTKLLQMKLMRITVYAWWYLTAFGEDIE